MVPDLPAAGQLTAAVMAAYDCHHHACVMEAFGAGEMKSSETAVFCFFTKKSCIRIDYFLWFDQP